MAVFNPANKPGIPTPEALMAAIIATKCNYVFSVPSFIEVCKFPQTWILLY